MVQQVPLHDVPQSELTGGQQLLSLRRAHDEVGWASNLGTAATLRRAPAVTRSRFFCLEPALLGERCQSIEEMGPRSRTSQWERELQHPHQFTLRNVVGLCRYVPGVERKPLPHEPGVARPTGRRLWQGGRRNGRRRRFSCGESGSTGGWTFAASVACFVVGRVANER